MKGESFRATRGMGENEYRQGLRVIIYWNIKASTTLVALIHCRKYFGTYHPPPPPPQPRIQIDTLGYIPMSFFFLITKKNYKKITKKKKKNRCRCHFFHPESALFAGAPPPPILEVAPMPLRKGPCYTRILRFFDDRKRGTICKWRVATVGNVGKRGHLSKCNYIKSNMGNLSLFEKGTYQRWKGAPMIQAKGLIERKRVNFPL